MSDKRKKILEKLRSNPKNVKFSTLVWLCSQTWGPFRINGSHQIWKTGNSACPTVNLQPQGKDAKRYQVIQVLKAIDLGS